MSIKLGMASQYRIGLTVPTRVREGTKISSFLLMPKANKLR